MVKQRATVRGLGADMFTGNVAEDHPVEAFADLTNGKIINIPVESITPNPEQPRKHFDETALGELAESIKTRGLLQPIIVTRRGEDFLLVAGERRYRASKLAGLDKIPCVVNSDNPLEIAIIENLQREDLTAVEEAEGLKALAEKYRYTHDRLAVTVGKSRTSITEILSLTKLPKEIRDECRTSDRWSKSVLLEIGRLEDQKSMLEAWENLKANGATVRAARAIKLKRPAEDKLFRHTYKDPEMRYTVTVKFEKENASKQEIVKALMKAVESLGNPRSKK